MSQTLDPVAQAFRISAPTGLPGIFLTGIDLYFSKKSSQDHGVTIYVLEMLNGYPNSNRTLPYSRKWLPASSINTSTTGATATTFTFEAPVYVKNRAEYAIVVKPDGNDPDYQMWVAETGAKDVIKKTQIFSVPNVGSLFIGASSSTWVVQPNAYLKFNVKRANFTANSGSAVFANINKEYFTINTLTYANSSTTIEPGDRIFKQINATPGAVNTSVYGVVDYFDESTNKLEIVYPSGTFAAGNVLQVHRAYDDSNTTYDSTTYQASVNVASIDNVKVNAIAPRFAQMQPPGTLLSFAYKGTSNSYVKSSAYTPVIIERETELLDSERIVASRSNEITQMSGANSADISIVFSSTSTWLSPVVDKVRSHAIAVGNLVDSTSANMALEYTNTGTAKTKYVSKPIALATGQEAEDVKVYVTAYRPAGSDVLVYVKALAPDDAESITSKTWSLLKNENATQYSDYRNTSNFIEYTYSFSNTVPNGTNVDARSNIIPNTAPYLLDDTTGVVYKDADGATYEKIKMFQIKIVLLASNSARIPRINDVRALALQM